MGLKSVRLSRAGSKTKTGATIVRSWDDLNHDLLVDIMKRVPWNDRLYVLCLVSKSWFSAVLGSMSVDGVINLQLMDCAEFRGMRMRFCRYLQLMLDNKPADSCSALVIGLTLLKAHKFEYIAKRTPSLQQLVITPAVGDAYGYIRPAFSYWNKLKLVECPAPLITIYPGNFRMVESLCLFGIVNDRAALVIRDGCPQLKKLMLISCALSMNALSMILDGHKNLELLDTRHSFRVHDCMAIGKKGCSEFVEWNEEEIRHKTTGIKVHLKCAQQHRAQQHCAQCGVRYFKCCFPELKIRDATDGFLYPGDYLI